MWKSGVSAARRPVWQGVSVSVARRLAWQGMFASAVGVCQPLRFDSADACQFLIMEMSFEKIKKPYLEVGGGMMYWSL